MLTFQIKYGVVFSRTSIVFTSYIRFSCFQGREQGLVTEDYDPYTDIYEGDEYDGDDYDYGDDDLDPCTESHYDLNNGETCSHIEFEKMPPIHEVKGVDDQLIYKPCCISNQTNGEPFHGYLHLDNCKVCKSTWWL